MTKKGILLTIILALLLMAIGAIIYKGNKIIYVNKNEHHENITINEEKST